MYLTTTNTGTGVDTRISKDAVEWSARIVNLRAFDEPPSSFDRAVARRWGLVVDLSGWSLIFVAVVSLAFQATYLQLLTQSELVARLTGRSIAFVLATGVVSFAAAESLSTYLFDSVTTEILGVDHRFNVPPIALHVVVLSSLLYFAWREKTPGRSAK